MWQIIPRILLIATVLCAAFRLGRLVVLHLEWQWALLAGCYLSAFAIMALAAFVYRDPDPEEQDRVNEISP